MRKTWSRMISCLLAAAMTVTSAGVPVAADTSLQEDVDNSVLIEEGAALSLHESTVNDEILTSNTINEDISSDGLKTEQEVKNEIITEFIPDEYAGSDNMSLIDDDNSIVEPMTDGLYPEPAKKDYTGLPITRAEWLDKLVTEFKLTADAAYMADDYYPDVTSSYQYYESIRVAVMYGLIDVEPGEKMNPDEPVTRQFASNTLNTLFGYLPQDRIAISDIDQSADGYNNAVVAVDMGWFALNSGAFNPDGSVKTDEAEDIMSTASATWNKRHDYSEEQSSMKYKDGVKVIKDSEFTINRDATMADGGKITSASIIVTDLTDALTPANIHMYLFYNSTV